MKVAVRASNRAASNLEFANAKKEEGNRLFLKSRFKDAELAYKGALTYLQNETDGVLSGSADTVVLLRSNIAACLIKHGDWASAITECSHAISLDPKHGKSLFRRGFCYTRLSQWKNAEADLIKAVEANPQDEKCKSELAGARRKVTELREKVVAHAKLSMQDAGREPKIAFEKVQIIPQSQALEFARAHLVKT